MKKTVFALLISHSFILFSQISEGGKPYFVGNTNNLKSFVQLPVFKLQKLNTVQLLKEDSVVSLQFRYSIFEDVNINLKEGLETKLPDNSGIIWRYKIKSPGAYSIQLIFKKYVVPDGAKLFIYDENFKNIAGAFTKRNMQNDSSFVIADFNGDSLNIEYFEPNNKSYNGQVILGSIGQAYKDIFNSNESQIIDIGINCPQGKDWQIQKHSVCLITFTTRSIGYLCSGALINNANNNGIPYFLTAKHCISDSNTVQTLVTYFNKEELGCTNNQLFGKTISGGSLLSIGTQSDYSLLKLHDIPPPSYQPYYAGWDASGYAGKYTVGIHQPRGKAKKITIGYKPAFSINEYLSWDDGSSSPPESHWIVQFDEGNTSKGSSGSPLFNESKRIIGQLHGGDTIYNLYGKLSYSWKNSNDGYKTLKEYLDPNNTGNLEMDGYFPASNIPDAQFYLEYPNICENSAIKFKDNSPFNPTYWSWSFQPDSVKFLNNTDALSENPIVKFLKRGQYNVKLIVKNDAGSDSLDILNALNSNKGINITVKPGVISNSCIRDFDSLLLIANGASLYNWYIKPGLEKYFYFSDIHGDSAIIKKMSGKSIDSISQLTIFVTGISDTCIDTIQYSYNFFKLINDNVENAIPLVIGKNGPFSNLCSTIQIGEPEPPHNSGVDQKSWCDQFGNGKNNLEHSVWFSFMPLKTGGATIRSSGIDCKIAMYMADSPNSILNYNYNLVAANDNIDNSTFDARLFNVPVSAGTKYWIQVDGGNGGLEGIFYLDISEASNSTNIKDISKNIEFISVFPQPANTEIFIKTEQSPGKQMTILIYNISGSLVFENKFQSSDQQHSLNIGNWSKGLYFVKIFSGNNIYNSKFIKE